MLDDGSNLQVNNMYNVHNSECFKISRGFI